MLRRKLLLGLGSLIAAFAILAIGAVLLLERLLDELDGNRAAITLYISRLHELGGQAIEVESALNGGGSLNGDAPDPMKLRFIAENLRRGADLIANNDLAWPDGSAAPGVRDRLLAALPVFAARIDAIAEQEEDEVKTQAGHDARPLPREPPPEPGTRTEADTRDVVLNSHLAMQTEILDLTRLARHYASERQAAITGYFRWVVLGIAVAAILVVNISVLVVLRITGMVLRPVDLLMRAGGEWALERFEHRVPGDLPGEFGQLASTYNRLAEQLAANEQRRLETLHQAARTLNHELNNALAIIELQVQLLHGRPQATEEMADRLARIRACLARMNGTIGALKQVRRIVLTDYAAGQKMLDLSRSVDDVAHSADSSATS